jgi:hypothetical protein
MGISEMWELSMLILHIRIPRLQPLLDDFVMSSSEGGSSSKNSNSSSSSTEKKSSSGDTNATFRSRENKQANYLLLKKEAKSDQYKEKLHEQNKYDIMLYENVTCHMCDQLHKLNLWAPYATVRNYWHEKSPFKSTKCP